ncbi:MAG: carboxyl transferase domain-containing protein [Porticoccaceae bacterium]|nr:carboxyl transferase domain-containing protein [Porticoccaceae bacterium]
MSRIQSSINPQSATYKENAEHYAKLLEQLRARHSEAATGIREKLIERHRQRGKMLARERIDQLLDSHTAFLELSPLAAYGQYKNEVPSAGIVTGIGQICGVTCMVIANDATVKGGSFFHETVKKHVRAQEIADQNNLPCIYLVDCGGAYLPEQDRVFPDKEHFGNTFYRQCQMSAKGLPQISAVFGGCTAGGAYIPALSDENIMVRGNARIHLGGPSIVKVAINEEIDGETLGGAEMHSKVSGVSDYLADDESEALARIREIMAKLNWPTKCYADTRPALPPRYSPEELPGVVSANPKMPYDVREIIARLVDDSDFHEYKPLYGDTLVCGTAYIHGYPVGLIGNNGALFSESSLKGAHFIELCNQRNTPLLFLHNITGFMVGSEAERGGIAKNSAKFVYAQATSRVAKFSVIVGGSYGAGNYGMAGRGFWPHFLFTWPSANCATMSADIASNVMTELRRSSIKGGAATGEELQGIEDGVRAQYGEQSDPYYATSRLWDDGIIEPADTRDVLGLCLALAAAKEPEAGPSPVYRM